MRALAGSSGLKDGSEDKRASFDFPTFRPPRAVSRLSDVQDRHLTPVPLGVMVYSLSGWCVKVATQPCWGSQK